MSNKQKESKIYGESAVRAFFRVRKHDLIRLFVREGEQGRFKDILSQCAKDRKLYRLVKQDELEKISESTHHEGICAIASPKPLLSLHHLLEEYISNFKGEPVIILDNVGNPHNLGAIIRSAAFFGLSRIIVISQTNYSMSGALARTSEGGLENCSICYLKNTDLLLKLLSDFGIILLISDPSSKNTDFNKLDTKKPYAIVLGNEALGVSKTLSDSAYKKFKIQGTNTIQSLNVSVSAGIIFNEFYKKALI